jgi:site-specific recombinase XerD
MGKSEIEAFLSHLATHRKVSASTQRQALNALVFLYKHVLDKPIGDNIAPVKAKKRRRPPVVMAKTEVRQILNQMKGTHLLMAKVMYGGGLRLMECLRLRVMDLDFAKSQVYVRGKGGKDRLTTLPPSIYDDLKAHLLRVKRISRP